MVWHVESQNAPITVCVLGKGRKRVFESQCCGKRHSQNQKHQKPLLFPFFPFFFKMKTIVKLRKRIQIHIKVSKWIVFNKKQQTAMTHFKYHCNCNTTYRVSQKNLATISLKVSIGGWGVSRSSPAISQFVSAQFQLHRACHKLLAREIP